MVFSVCGPCGKNFSGCAFGSGMKAGFGFTVTVCGSHQFDVVNVTGVNPPGTVIVIGTTICPSGFMNTVTLAVGALVRRSV